MNGAPDDIDRPGTGRPGTDPVERYLDELADRLPLRGHQLRRVLAEVEDHLTASTQQKVRDGLSGDEAARQAVADFGAPELVARTMTHSGGPPTVALATQAFLSLLFLGAVGLVAIGVSGLLAWGAGAEFGKAFVAGDPLGVSYTPDRCADLRTYAPGADSCAAAAVSHHFDETVVYRLAAGALGLLALGAWVALVRPWRRRRGASYDVLPASVTPVVGLVLFGLATLMLPFGLLDVVFSGPDHGAGGLISAGLVSAVAACGFAVALWRTLPPQPA
ncbi:MAG: permease prefix domain 1-containing protein [Actinomycetes bacterium]